MKTLRRFTIVPFAVLALALAGCGILGGGDDGGNEEEENGSNGGGGEAAGEPGTLETDEAVAEATYPVSSIDGGSVDLAIHELAARGDLAQLTFSVTVHDPEGGGHRNPTLYRVWGAGALETSLVDMDNLNRHEVVSDDNQEAMRPYSVDTGLDYGEPRPLTWVFAAPPEEVAQMDVYIGEYPPFTDIPVVRQ